MTTVTTSPLSVVREAIVDALNAEPFELEDGPVHVNSGPEDAVEPPCYVLTVPEPWLLPVGVCTWQVRYAVLAVAGRIEPNPGLDHLEILVLSAMAALKRARLPVETVGSAAPWEAGGVNYYASRITVSLTVNLEGL